MNSLRSGLPEYVQFSMIAILGETRRISCILVVRRLFDLMADLSTLLIATNARVDVCKRRQAGGRIYFQDVVTEPGWSCRREQAHSQPSR
jgi:hypothetical protein